MSETGSSIRAELLSCGEDVRIAELVTIRRPKLVSIGSHIAIDEGFYCTTGLELGDYIHIGPYVCVIGGAETSLHMGHFSGIAANSTLVCAGEDYASGDLVNPTIPLQYRSVVFGPIHMEPFTTLGVQVTVMPGVTIKEGSVVGANSVVTKDTEPWGIYLGSPARRIRDRPREKAYRAARDLGYEFP